MRINSFLSLIFSAALCVFVACTQNNSSADVEASSTDSEASAKDSETSAKDSEDTATDIKGSKPYKELNTGNLEPNGCETYIGAHPVYPDELLCCSAPRKGVAPVCSPGDKPDIPCVIEYTFCDNGKASKAYSPDPKTGYPGHTVSTSGSWAVNSDTGELTIKIKDSAMGGAMITESKETYPYSFTYDNGNKLDLHSAASVDIDTTGIGEYQRVSSHNSVISGMWDATMTVISTTKVTVSDTGYEATLLQDVTCEPKSSMVCQVVPKPEVKITTGTHTLPLELHVTSSGQKLYQTREAKVLVFERQPSPCEGVSCGEHGYCEDGDCVCSHGYTGKYCDEPGPCAQVNCGENAICVEGNCECNRGYTGKNCEEDVNECDPSPCLNGGTCQEGVPGTYECTCNNGYTGKNCERCPADNDGDGYGHTPSALCTHPELDCDDSRATVHPGAPELCDGLDNQCPGDPGYGTIDEGYAVCAEMIPIPSGCFDMGDAFAEGWPDELPVHNVCLSSFEMDRHEITNAEYAECVDDGTCSPPGSLGSHSRVAYYGDPAYGDYPVVWMEWHQLDEYCIWAGKRLPTEAEWEYAARGGLKGKRYPWGDTISHDDANYDMHVGDTTQVESYAPNGYGLYDMAGNVWEWVSDWFEADYYSKSPKHNPRGPVIGLRRVSRGGSWDHGSFGLRTANRCDFCHTSRHGNNLGGRCAR